eukprot:scaffold55649_cov76-Phaeocystis_antarctica.AAC.2
MARVRSTVQWCFPALRVTCVEGCPRTRQCPDPADIVVPRSLVQPIGGTDHREGCKSDEHFSTSWSQSSKAVGGKKPERVGFQARALDLGTLSWELVYARCGRLHNAFTRAISHLHAPRRTPREAVPSSAPRQASCVRRRRSAARPPRSRAARGSASSAPLRGRRGAPAQAQKGA